MNTGNTTRRKFTRDRLLAILHDLPENVILEETFRFECTEVTYAYRHGIKRVRLDRQWQSVRGPYLLSVQDLILLAMFDDYDYAKKEWVDVDRDWSAGRSRTAPEDLFIARAIRNQVQEPDVPCWIQHHEPGGVMVSTSKIDFYLQLDLAEPLEFTAWDDLKTDELREIHCIIFHQNQPVGRRL